MRGKESRGGLCRSLPLVRFLRIKPCSGLRADTFSLRCPAASRLVRPFCGTQNLYLFPGHVQASASYRHSFSEVDHIPNSRFNHTAITGSGIIA